MFRKAIILVLTLAAVVSGAVSITLCVTQFPPLVHGGAGFRISEDDKPWGWVRVGSQVGFIVERRSKEAWRKASFTCIGFSLRNSEHFIIGHVSIWIPIGVTFLLATYPTIAFIHGPLRRWRRRRNGLCLDCGYDLTGNVSGVCSECGTTMPLHASNPLKTSD